MTARRLPIVALGAVLAVTSAGPVCAQHVADASRATPVCLRMSETLDLGARFSPEVEAAKARLAESEAELTQARSLYRPQVSAFARTGLGDTGLTDSRIENQFGARLSQRIFDFGDAKFAREAARANAAARGLDITATEMQAAEAVGRAHIGWLETRDRLTATREREAYFARQLASTKTLVASGGATVADRADIEAELLNAEAARIDLEFLLERFATLLSIATQRKDLPCDPENSATTLARMMPKIEGGGDAVDRIAAGNPAIGALRKSAAGSVAAAEREARARYPVISAVGISSYAIEDIGARGDFRNRVGIDLSVPLYSGRAQTARIDAARARARQAAAEVGEAERKLREDVSIGVRRIAALEMLVGRRTDTARNRQEQLLASERQFERGLKTLPELIVVRRQFEDAELGRIETFYELQRERLKVAQLAGSITAAR